MAADGHTFPGYRYKKSALCQELEVVGDKIVVKEEEKGLIVVPIEETSSVLIKLLGSAEISKESETTASTSPILTTDFYLANTDGLTVSSPVLEYTISSMLTLKTQVQL
jgi:hypothetical protein